MDDSTQPTALQQPSRVASYQGAAHTLHSRSVWSYISLGVLCVLPAHLRSCWSSCHQPSRPSSSCLTPTSRFIQELRTMQSPVSCALVGSGINLSPEVEHILPPRNGEKEFPICQDFGAPGRGMFYPTTLWLLPASLPPTSWKPLLFPSSLREEVICSH